MNQEVMLVLIVLGFAAGLVRYALIRLQERKRRAKELPDSNLRVLHIFDNPTEMDIEDAVAYLRSNGIDASFRSLIVGISDREVRSCVLEVPAAQYGSAAALWARYRPGSLAKP